MRNRFPESESRPVAPTRSGGSALEFNHAMIYTAGLQRALEFYRDALGFEVVDLAPDVYARLKSPGGDTTIALHLMNPGQSMNAGAEGLRLYFEVKELDAFCGALAAKGIRFDQMPKDMPWGWRHAYLRDPDGHEISLYRAGTARLQRTVMADPVVRSREAAPAVEQPTLTTERLLLRPFRLDDARAVQQLAGDRAIADTTLAIPHPYPDGAAEQWIATHAPGYAAGIEAAFAVTLRADGTLVGASGLRISPTHARAELGYWIGVPFWRRGFATEAGRAVVDFGFERLRLHRIHAYYLTRNPASGRVLQKLGMQWEGVRRHAVRKWEVFEDLGQYAILATDPGRGPQA